MPTDENRLPNRLINEKSPYLLQHAHNPVDWWPWCDEAFAEAKAGDKPVFLSVGYSTCHWCHVMAHESFEDERVAQILNDNFISIKVDKEERPDIDSIYMSACMALTGSGGWPMTIIMEHTGKPFFAGTYFPKTRRYGAPGFIDILEAVTQKWKTDRQALLNAAEQITAQIKKPHDTGKASASADSLCGQAVEYFKAAFDPRFGGFGRAPKFPSPHNLLFLMAQFEAEGDKKCLFMAEKTLGQMAKGGIFDHIGFGFSRYSTDDKWLVPHFEKMLYDNALLLAAYAKAYMITRKPLYRSIAEKVITYLSREMTNQDGAFFSAQDADSDGVEGKYYVFTPEEIISVLGEADGQAFCEIYDITEHGNFEGKSIPNQIGRSEFKSYPQPLLDKLCEYRKTRTSLHCDDKVLTAWNALMIAALADCAVAFGEQKCFDMARRAMDFVEAKLHENGRLYASWRDGRHSESGFLDDYAFTICALLRMYYASADEGLLDRAKTLARRTIEDFFDREAGGFYLYGNAGEQLIIRPKESYDGAIPSGNSVMAINLIWLSLLTGEREFEDVINKHTRFMNARTALAPGGQAFYLYSQLQQALPGRKITAVLANKAERESVRLCLQGMGWVVILDGEKEGYRLKDRKTTFYVCEDQACMPPVNELTGFDWFVR